MTAYDRPICLRMGCDGFLLQTDPHWILHVVYDGPAPKAIKDVMALYKDEPRILFRETPVKLNDFGHPNRKMMLETLEYEPDDYVLITNEDNYYVPTFVEQFLSKCDTNVGFVFCFTLHSYLQYGVLQTRIEENYIDMGSFIVKFAVAKEVGFNHVHLSADGTYAVECATECKKKGMLLRYIAKSLFIHN